MTDKKRMLLVFIFVVTTCILVAAHDHPDTSHTHHQPFVEDHTHIFAIPTVFEPLDKEEHRPRIIITTSSYEPVDIFVTVEGVSFQHDAKVSKTKQVEIALPVAVRLASPGISNKTVVVKSSGVINVHCIDNEYESGDGFLALPNAQLSTKYYVMSYGPFHHEKEYNPGFVCVSAVEDGTVVEIKNLESGQKREIPLDSWDSYRYERGYFDDLTGTQITSNKPVSVVSGIFTRVPHGTEKGADGLLESLPPYDAWGRSFVLSPFLGRASGYVYRVLTGDTKARLTISNRPNTVTINADYWFEGHVDDDTLITIDSSQPVLVFQYMKSNQDDEQFEPSMMMVPPISAYDNDVITFPVFNCTFANDFQYNIHVTIQCAYVHDLILDDDTPMSDWKHLKSKDNKMCVARGAVTTGVHSVSHSDERAKFTVAVYGLHRVSSYAYPAGYKPVMIKDSPVTPVVVIVLIVAFVILLLLIAVLVILRLRRRPRYPPKPTNEVYTTLENQTT